MIILKPEELLVLEPLLPDLQTLLEADDPEAFFLAFDELTTEYLTDDQQDLTEKGVELQKLYDRIYYRHKAQ